VKKIISRFLYGCRLSEKERAFIYGIEWHGHGIAFHHHHHHPVAFS